MANMMVARGRADPDGESVVLLLSVAQLGDGSPDSPAPVEQREQHLGLGLHGIARSHDQELVRCRYVHVTPRNSGGNDGIECRPWFPRGRP